MINSREKIVGTIIHISSEIRPMKNRRGLQYYVVCSNRPSNISFTNSRHRCKNKHLKLWCDMVYVGIRLEPVTELLVAVVRCRAQSVGGVFVCYTSSLLAVLPTHSSLSLSLLLLLPLSLSLPLFLPPSLSLLLSLSLPAALCRVPRCKGGKTCLLGSCVFVRLSPLY